MGAGEKRDGVPLTNLDQPLFDGADATKRDLVDYLDAVHDRIIPELRDRPLSVIRVRPRPGAVHAEERPEVHAGVGADGAVWAEASHREVSYALCNDRRTLLWFANQRAVEYHPTLVRADRPDTAHLPRHRPRPARPATRSRWPPRAAHLVRQVLADAGLTARSRPAAPRACTCSYPSRRRSEDVAAATRAIAARAERLDPALATTAFIREDREGKVFLDSTRAGGATVVAGVQPADPAGRAGVVPGGLG